MNVSRSSDASLYELAIESYPAPQPLKISPTTFKSMIGLLFDVLIERQLPATLWLKLPKGEIWQAEMQRFCQSATAAYSLYNLQSQSEEGESGKGGKGGKGGKSGKGSKGSKGASASWDNLETMLDERLIAHQQIAVSELGSQFYELPLAADSQLKREYFVMVAAPEFYGLVLAHRPRSGRTKSEGRSELPNPLGAIGEEALEQKHPLLGLCSFDPATLQPVLDGINRAICLGQPETQSGDELGQLLIAWDQLAGSIGTLNPTLLSHLLNKQIQRQEEIWRNSAAYRRQAETASALRMDNEELLNSLRQKDEFVKAMGQELRTPLTTMKTALSLLNSPIIKPPQRQKYMEMLSQECDRQSSLITSVLDLIQIESTVDQVPLEALRLSEIVPGIVSTYQPLAQEKGISLGYTIPDDLLPVSCLSHRLKQIVIHLLHNSIKFTPTGGQVWVRSKQQGDYVQLEFRDTGIGIAPSDLPRIFERFYRIRMTAGEDSSGSGLGLSIVQQLLLRCGGSITVKSKVGEGSAFTVLLPVYRP